jgi:hypothetical protein
VPGHFEAKKHAYRQCQDGIVISFVVHPNDLSAEVATAPLGTRYMVAFAQIGDDEQPTEQPKPERPKQSWSSMSRAQQAGILCNDRNFANWLGYNDYETNGAWVSYAIGQVYHICGVGSRALLDSTPDTAKKWDALVSKYRQATGQMAEMRP